MVLASILVSVLSVDVGSVSPLASFATPIIPTKGEDSVSNDLQWI